VTIEMQDSADAWHLTSEYDAFVAYTDGYYPTLATVLSRFPNAHILSLTTGLGPADGIDVESGNVGWDGGLCRPVPGWVHERAASGVVRPVVYISASYSDYITRLLGANGIGRDEFRLFSAHWWGEAPHICGSGGCPYPPADATQYQGNIGGSNGYDLSLCSDDFFNITAPKPVVPAPPAPIEPSEEDTMEYLVEAKGPTVKAGLRNKNGAVAGSVFIVDTAQKVKRQLLTQEEIALYKRLVPADRQLLGDSAVSCAELAATPSA
jgi:hypothetical protein